MNKQKKATVLIYVLFLVTLSMVIATIILDNFFKLSSYVGLSDREVKLNSNVRSHATLQVNLLKRLNSNGGGFLDNISCPSLVTMSGSTHKSIISTSLFKEVGNIYCIGGYDNGSGQKLLKIFFNEDFTDLIEVEYDNNSIGVYSGLASIDFGDSDQTIIDFSPATSYKISDNFDDNLNSDNYKGNSTGSISYPNFFEDDDNLARKIVFGYVTPEEGMKKIFWKNTKLANYISGNINNIDNLNKNLGSVSAGILYLDIDKAYDMRLDVFNKNRFESTNEIIITSSLSNSGSTGELGFIQNDLSLAETITGNEYTFDFVNNDYGLFIKDTGTGTLLYKFKAEEKTTGSGIYINPIDDSGENLIKFLGNEIIVNSKNNYLTKQMELIFKK